MKKYDEYKKEMDELYVEGLKLYDALNIKAGTKEEKDLRYFVYNYEVWYSKALNIVKFFLPDRAEDFAILYKNEKRKSLGLSTYTISDALRGISNIGDTYGPKTASMLVYRQCDIIKACKQQFESRICNVKTTLQADVFDSEIDASKHLLKRGFLRAAGAICGVILEKHFSGVCKNRNIQIKKKSPTIADFNDVLKDNIYDIVEWRKIQHLGDIRNLCDHNKDREPTKEEVEELISGTDRVIKTIF